jgi:hypothetical protein
MNKIILFIVLFIISAGVYAYYQTNLATDPLVSVTEQEITAEPSDGDTMSETVPTQQSNPMFQENELGGEMILPQNPSDETSDATATDHDAIIGMSVDQANNYADRLGVDFRTGTIDGEPQALTMDYRVGRITAEITDGIVVGYTVEE